MIFGTFERMVAFRYLRARRQEGFVSVIAIFSLLGIMLGVATLIIVMAVMNGFRQELLSKILGLNGAPSPGEEFNVLKNEREARELAECRRRLGCETEMADDGNPSAHDRSYP